MALGRVANAEQTKAQGTRDYTWSYLLLNHHSLPFSADTRKAAFQLQKFNLWPFIHVPFFTLNFKTTKHPMVRFVLKSTEPRDQVSYFMSFALLLCVFQTCCSFTTMWRREKQVFTFVFCWCITLPFHYFSIIELFREIQSS